MIRHDLNCPGCDYEMRDQLVEAGRYGDCPRCGTGLRWTPFAFATDVRGSEQTSQVLCDPDNTDLPLRWTSSRERDAKMARQGCVPAGDRVHGALGVGNGPARQTITSIGKRPREKSRVSSADGAWKAT